MPDNRQRTLAHHSDPIFWIGLSARFALAIFLFSLKAGILAATKGSVELPTYVDVLGAFVAQYVGTFFWYRLVLVVRRQDEVIRRQNAEIARLRLRAPQK